MDRNLHWQSNFYLTIISYDQKITCSYSTIKQHLEGLIIQQTKLQTHTKIHAPTASHVATGPESSLYRELSTFPWWACRLCGPRRCWDAREGGAKIDCKCWIIQPSPPPFEWVSSVTMRRAFIAKQEKIIFHRPPWRPWTPLINETKHLQPRHTDKDTLKQIYTHTRTEIVTHTHADMHAKILLTLISHSCTHALADFESMQAHRAGKIIECETAKWS